MSSRVAGSSRVALRGLFATTLLLGAGLVATTWMSWSSAEAIAETVTRGQGEAFMQALHGTALGHRGPPPESALAAFVAAHGDEGLRAIAVVAPDGSGFVSAGPISRRELTEDEARGPRALARVGERVRLVVALPPPVEGPPPIPPGGKPPHGGPPRVVLEFEPVLANQLVARASRTLALGLSTAALLLVAAIVFWRRARRADAASAEQARNERLASLGTMSAVLAHEIKNPLAALKGHAQLLVESLPDGSRPRSQADRVVDAAIRLQGLVGNLLDFVRDGGIERVPADPAELLCAAAADAAPDAELELDDAPASWPLDPVRIRQVLENLLRNAVQAAPDGRVIASIRMEGETLVLTIRDDGEGLPNGAEESIFEPFFTTKTRGVGLGLAVARRVVELHGGRITAKNRAGGRGAELRVAIPRASRSI